MPAVHNSRMLLNYMRIDPTVRLLALAVKHWVKSRAIVGTREGYLSSYAIVLLVVFFGQRRQLLPCLSNHSPDRLCRQIPSAGGQSQLDWQDALQTHNGSDDGGFNGGAVEMYNGRSCDCRFAEPTDEDIAAYRDGRRRIDETAGGISDGSDERELGEENDGNRSSRPKDLVGVLLLSFFRFVIGLIDHHEEKSTLPSRRIDVVSVKNACLLSREEAWSSFAWLTLTNKKGNLKANLNRLSIQDPFNLAHDVGSPLRRDQEFIAELRRAERLLLPAALDEPQLQRRFVEMVCDASDLTVQVEPDGWHVPRKSASAAQKRQQKRNARKKQRAFLEAQKQRNNAPGARGGGRSPPATQQPPPPESAEDVREGDWLCEKNDCGTNNPTHRDICFKCKAKKPQPELASSAPAPQEFHAAKASGHAIESHKPGKYCCPDCGEYFPTWAACLKHLKEEEHTGAAQLGITGNGWVLLQKRCMVF